MSLHLFRLLFDDTEISLSVLRINQFTSGHCKIIRMTLSPPSGDESIQVLILFEDVFLLSTKLQFVLMCKRNCHFKVLFFIFITFSF